MGFYGVLNVGVVQFLVLYRVYVVWDNRTRIRNALLSGYALAIAAGIVFTIIAVVQVAPHSLYSSELGSCLFTTKSYYLIGSWSAMLFYDIYVSLLLVGNSLNKPRRHNTEILRNLYRDGILSFLCLFGLQLAKLVPSIVGGPSDMLLTPLIAWSLDGVIVMRLFLKVRDIEVNARKGFGWKSVTMLDSKTQPQVPVLVFEEVEMEVI
ncbi:uncharacterized protein FIBRA_06238 [Fibroporia radiculosa]|uniref:G-protein coupled receptors family 1 profile domain-containing protein n=1 Tax=Fibroporia radiculosa TaxID=599839 RepID=J4H3Z0_9APHY|nr:uncharacterized protein FIBRA_06238 [Fibroporia radiculosa]CCM04079.1 predicted protein [Fibroporia radiculosa]